MFTYLVLEPSIFQGSRYLADPRYASDVERVLRAVLQNGCLLLDAEDDLLREMLREINGIPPKYRQRVRTLLETLKLGVRGKTRLIECAAHVPPRARRNASLIVMSLLTNCGADGVVTPRERSEAFVALGVSRELVIAPETYEESMAEKRRATLAQPEALSRVNSGVAEDLFRRLFRFARWLRIYDKQIGKGGNTVGFRDGIDYLLKQWAANAHDRVAGAKVEIVTAVKQSPPREASDSAKAALRTANAAHIRTVEDQVVAPLRRKFQFDISLEVREDPDHEFHARFYETNVGAVKLDPGADILTRAGRFKRVYLDQADHHQADLAALYNLPRITYRADGAWQVG